MSDQFPQTLESGSPSKTFAQYKMDRKEQLEQVTNDIQVHQEREIQSLQETLRNLMDELDLVNGKLAAEEKEFITKKESLYSELKKIQIQADISFSQLRIDHINEIDKMKHDFNLWLQDYSKIVPSIMKDYKPVEFPPQKFMTSPSRRTMKIVDQDEEDSSLSLTRIEDIDDATEEVFNKRIEILEDQKTNLLDNIRSVQRENERNLHSLYKVVENQENKFQRQLSQIQNRMQSKEEKYEAQLNKLYENLEKLKGKRKAIADKRNKTVNLLQSRVNKLESESSLKIREATHQAENLKKSLINSNMIKEQNLELERKRNAQTLQLHQESLSLQHQLFETQRELQKEKAEAQQWRTEFSRQMGPRRTMTMFT